MTARRPDPGIESSEEWEGDPDLLTSSTLLQAGESGNTGIDDEGEPRWRRPIWVTLSVTVNVCIAVALLPLAMVLLVPPFVIYIVELAKLVVWLSPLLAVGNVLSLLWGFPRKRPVVTAVSMLGVVFLVAAFIIAVYAAGGRDPISVLGIPFGGER